MKILVYNEASISSPVCAAFFKNKLLLDGESVALFNLTSKSQLDFMQERLKQDDEIIFCDISGPNGANSVSLSDTYGTINDRYEVNPTAFKQDVIISACENYDMFFYERMNNYDFGIVHFIRKRAMLYISGAKKVLDLPLEERKNLLLIHEFRNFNRYMAKTAEIINRNVWFENNVAYCNIQAMDHPVSIHYLSKNLPDIDDIVLFEMRNGEYYGSSYDFDRATIEVGGETHKFFNLNNFSRLKEV